MMTGSLEKFRIRPINKFDDLTCAEENLNFITLNLNSFYFKSQRKENFTFSHSRKLKSNKQ